MTDETHPGSKNQGAGNLNMNSDDLPVAVKDGAKNELQIRDIIFNLKFSELPTVVHLFHFLYRRNQRLDVVNMFLELLQNENA